MATFNKTIPLGKPLPLTDEQLDKLAQVTPVDIVKAQALWRASVAPAFRTLLDAQAIDPQKPRKKVVK